MEDHLKLVKITLDHNSLGAGLLKLQLNISRG
jgi:hypothetical protein